MINQPLVKKLYSFVEIATAAVIVSPVLAMLIDCHLSTKCRSFTWHELVLLIPFFMVIYLSISCLISNLPNYPARFLNLLLLFFGVFSMVKLQLFKSETLSSGGDAFLGLFYIEIFRSIIGVIAIIVLKPSE